MGERCVRQYFSRVAGFGVDGFIVGIKSWNSEIEAGVDGGVESGLDSRVSAREVGIPVSMKSTMPKTNGLSPKFAVTDPEACSIRTKGRIEEQKAAVPIGRISVDMFMRHRINDAIGKIV